MYNKENQKSEKQRELNLYLQYTLFQDGYCYSQTKKTKNKPKTKTPEIVPYIWNFYKYCFLTNHMQYLLAAKDHYHQTSF